MRFQKIGIIHKPRLRAAQVLAAKAEKILRKKSKKPLTVFSDLKSALKKADAILIFGGDGTFLSVARQMMERSVPLMGFHMGQLGFLTEFKKEELEPSLDLLLRSKLHIQSRALMECLHYRRVKNKDVLWKKSIVVNDVVLGRGAIARIFDLEVYVDDSFVTTMRADGLIASTPTGSTAYNLAAGGPILYPSLPVVSLIPICAHSLTLRPLVLSNESSIRIIPKVKTHPFHNTIILTLDGQESRKVMDGDFFILKKFSKHSLQLFRSPDRDYFTILREKLKYGYRD